MFGAAAGDAYVLVDLRLPEADGRDLIAQLRADDSGLGILVVSAWSSEDAILGARRANRPIRCWRILERLRLLAH